VFEVWTFYFIEMLKDAIVEDLAALSNPLIAAGRNRFFKCGKGEYSERDVFLGVSVPDQRLLVKKHLPLLQNLEDLIPLVTSNVHEHRHTALLFLVEKYESLNRSKPKLSDAESERRKIFDFYMSHLAFVNNWDLVDCSAWKIVGSYLIEENCSKRCSILVALASSSNFWERRISIVSTMAFISQRRFDETMMLAEMLLEDPHDLIHKAVGWMLREVGKRNQTILEAFLRKHCEKMPRVMLRYAIERLPLNKRKRYLRTGTH